MVMKLFVEVLTISTEVNVDPSQVFQEGKGSTEGRGEAVENRKQVLYKILLGNTNPCLPWVK